MWRGREVVASSPSADSLLMPVPSNQTLLRRAWCSWSDAQLDCAAILTLKLLLFRTCRSLARKQHVNVQ